MEIFYGGESLLYDTGMGWYVALEFVKTFTECTLEFVELTEWTFMYAHAGGQVIPGWNTDPQTV